MKKKLFLLSFISIGYIALCQKEIKCDSFQEPVGKYIVTEKGSYNNPAFGIIDTLGNTIYEPNFVNYPSGIHFRIFDDIIYEYSKDKKLYRFINLNTKKPITDYKINSFKNFDNGYALVEEMDKSTSNIHTQIKSKKYYFTDKNGTTVCKLPENASKTSIKHSDHGSFYDGLAKIKFILNDGESISNDLLYGYIDKSGKIVVQPKYIQATNFYEGLACVQLEKENGLKQWGVIDKKGNKVIDFKYTIQPASFSDGLSLVTTKTRKKGFVDKTGKIIIDPIYTLATGFYKGYAIVKKEYKSPYELINTKGEVVYTFSKVRKFIYFDSSHNSSQRNDFIKHFINEGAAIVFIHKIVKPQVIDFKENILFGNNVYTKIERYSSGLSRMSKYDKTTKTRTEGFINKQGEFVIVKSQNQF